MTLTTVQLPHAKHNVDADTYERLVDSQPILSMLALLEKTGRPHFNENRSWEVCLCALILKREPRCPVLRILEALPYHHDPMDAADVLNTMAHLGYVGRPAPAKLEDMDERLLPGLFIPHHGDPCIIVGRDKDGCLQFYDPLARLISQVPPSFDHNGTVWFFQPYDEQMQPTSKFMRKGSEHHWFRALLGRFRGTVAQVMVAGLILNIIALVTPLFIMLVYDRVIAAGTIGPLPMLTLGAIIAIGFEWKLRRIRSTGLSWLTGRLDNLVGNRIFAHLIGLTPNLIERASVSAQIARIKTFESVRDFFSGSVFLSLLEAPFMIISIAAIALLAGPLVFVPLAMATLYSLLFVTARQKVKTSIRLAAKTSSARQQFTIETFEKLEAIRGQGLEHKWLDKFRHLSGREMMSHFHLTWLGMIAESLAHALTVLSAVATLGFGVHMIWAGDLSTGALLACMILVWRILTPFYSLCTMIPRLEQLRNSIAQVNDLMDIETEAEEARSFSRLPRLKGAVSFQYVTFRYTPDGDDIFSELTFNVEPGELVALTGNDGSGKGVILKLIQSLYPAAHGTIRIDGFDNRQLDATDLRRQIAYVPKTPHFFHGSVLENVRHANPLADIIEVERALKDADAWGDIQALPNGIHSIIGMHEGISLSASLASRLSLARAMLHPGHVMLVDELPNTLLSSTTGAKLKRYLNHIRGKRTVLICTYRDDFIQLADKLVWLRGSEPPISGTRDAVLAHMNPKPKAVA